MWDRRICIIDTENRSGNLYAGASINGGFLTIDLEPLFTLQRYPSYLCGNVVREDALSTYPELSGILLALEGQITDADMAGMNYQVDTEGKDPKEVALAFLHEKGLL